MNKLPTSERSSGISTHQTPAIRQFFTQTQPAFCNLQTWKTQPLKNLSPQRARKLEPKGKNLTPSHGNKGAPSPKPVREGHNDKHLMPTQPLGSLCFPYIYIHEYTWIYITYIYIQYIYIYVLLPSLIIVSLRFDTKPPKFRHIGVLRLKPAIFC